MEILWKSRVTGDYNPQAQVLLHDLGAFVDEAAAVRMVAEASRWKKKSGDFLWYIMYIYIYQWYIYITYMYDMYDDIYICIYNWYIHTYNVNPGLINHGLLIRGGTPPIVISSDT